MLYLASHSIARWEAVEAINKHREDGAKVISIDIPSGIEADSGKVLGCAVKADITIACAFKKPGELLYPGVDYVGELRRADIGITERSITGEIKTLSSCKTKQFKQGDIRQSACYRRI